MVRGKEAFKPQPWRHPGKPVQPAITMRGEQP